MPICFIEAPVGIRHDAKKKLVEKTTAALDEAYHIPDVRIFFREYAPANYSQDGNLETEPARPVCFLEAPPLPDVDSKRKMITTINAALVEAYGAITNAEEVLVMLNEYQLENVGSAGRLQSENPELTAVLKSAQV